ncbi:unnamed protein product, partial [Rotaria magnacalcarata]
SSTSFEDQNVTLRSYIDESLATTQSRRASVTQSDALKPLDSSIEISMRRDNHYVKNSLSNRSGNTITSLKRRVRKVCGFHDFLFDDHIKRTNRS